MQLQNNYSNFSLV